MDDQNADTSHAPDISVVIPCYNEEDAIAETVETLENSWPENLTVELLVVDDGSSDRTAPILSELAEKYERLVVLTHKFNRGYGAALKTGVRNARAQWIAITDADGTYPNEELGRLFEMTDRADMVVGSRTAPGTKYSWVRSIPKVFLKAYCSYLAGDHIPDMNSGFRLFRRELALLFEPILPDGFSFTTTITLAMLTNRLRVHYEPIVYKPRIGKSKIRPIRDTINFFQLIVRTATYFAPGRVFFPIGLTLGLGATISLGYDAFVNQNLTDKTVLLFLFSMNTMMFALLADMFAKRLSVVDPRLLGAGSSNAVAGPGRTE